MGRIALETTQVPLIRLVSVSEPDPDARIAALTHDIAGLRRVLHEYMQQREAAEEELRGREEALRRSSDAYRSLIRRAAYGIYRSSIDGRFLEANPALASMLGYESVDELLRADLLRDIYLDPNDRDRLIAERLAGAIGDEDWQDVRWKRRDGGVIIVRLSVQIVRDAEGSIAYLEGIVDNVTERVRREEAHRRSERMASLGSTLAGVAHELNNPLAAISGFAQLLLREQPRSEEDRSALDTIHHEAARAAKIVRDLLTLSRTPDQGQRRSRVDLNTVVGYLLTTRRYALEARGIEATIELAPDLPPVLADRTQLEQVLLNLIVNAEQALREVADSPSPAGRSPRLTVRTWSDESRVSVEISDSGPGIPPEALSRIWDPFWTTKPEGEGTGLGLSVAHSIVTAHGGTIEVESAPVLGTRFVVALPTLSRATEAAADQAALAVAGWTPPAFTGDPPDEPSGERSARPLDVLAIDDETSILRFLTRYLGARGHAVVAARDGTEALRLADQMPLDVVICDLRLPGMDGGEIIRRLRRHPNVRRARFVLSTGDTASAAARARIAAIAADAVVGKPYNVEELRLAVEDRA